MILLTWNIQWGLGIDGRVDLERIRDEVAKIADADVICLQELSDGFDDLRGNFGGDQFAAIERLFPQYACISGPVVDVPAAGSGRRRFGNVILSRLPVGQVLRHTLPWGTVAGAECMPRGLIEAVVLAGRRPLRIMTTHLEWSSPLLRARQVAAIRDVHCAATQRAGLPPTNGKGPYRVQPAGPSAILCGDFNALPDAEELVQLREPAAGGLGFVDTWAALHPGHAHPPSMCVHDQADGPPRCLDYVFVTSDLVPALRGVTYRLESQASDHQPVVLDLDM
jgi:endonuclease/exonuclease/phosphatase family metal-dependent hydrolase